MILNKIDITPAQLEQLLEMCRSFFPKLKFRRARFGSDIIFEEQANSHWEQHTAISWFELCVTHVAEKVAQEFAKQPFGTHSYARFYIVQTLFSQLAIKHPIDFLYDMWKNPQNYAQTL